MNVQKQVDRWVQQARYDLDTAQAMFEAGRYLYVGFMCQQAIEKLLKGIHLCATSQLAPYTHNLIRLSELVELEANTARDRHFGELQRYYVGSRYPEEVEKLAEDLDAETAQDILQQTKEYFTCLERLIKA